MEVTNAEFQEPSYRKPFPNKKQKKMKRTKCRVLGTKLPKTFSKQKIRKKMKRGKFIERARHSRAHRDAPITF